MESKEYRDQWRKEFFEFCKYKNLTHEEIIQAYKLNKRFPNLCTPCEDCDNCFCENPCSRVFWCPDNM